MTTPPPGADRPTWARVLDLADQLTTCESVTEQCDVMVATVARELDAEASLWLAQSLWQCPGSGGTECFPPTPPTALMARAAAAFQPVVALPEDADCWHRVAMPLLDRGDVVGVLQVDRRGDTPFTYDELEILDCAVGHFAIVLQSTRRLVVESWRSDQLALVRQVSMQIANVIDQRQLAARVAELIQQTFKYYYVAVFVLQPARQVLHLKASAGPTSLHDQHDGPVALDTIPVGEGIIGFVAQTGAEVIAHDVDAEPRYIKVEALPDTQSEVTLPLKVEDRVLGVLDVQSDRPWDVHEIDLLVLRTLAENVAIAVDHADMIYRLERRADQVSVIARVNQAVASILDEELLLDQVVALIDEQLDYPSVHLFTVDSAQAQIVYRAGSGRGGHLAQQDEPVFQMDSQQDIIPWVAGRGETVLENDIRDDPRFGLSPMRSDEVHSELVVPLAFSGQVLGVLDVQSDQPDAFDMDSYFMFRALADSVAIALRNATLYRSERWRRQVADSMREVAGLLSSDLVLEQLLDAILAELARTLPCDISATCLLEEEDLAVVSVMGSQPGLALTTFSADASLWLAEALSAEQPLIRPPGSPVDPIAEASGFSPQYSAVAAPMRVGGRQIGLLYLAHETPGRYGVESQVITSAFANYTAVAIENARVYQASQEQGLISAVMHQVAEATQSLSTLDEVLEAIVRLMPLLVGINRCAIMLRDESGTLYLPAACYGLSPAQQSTFESWSLTVSQLTAFTDVFATQTSVVIHDVAGDPRTRDTVTSSLGFDSLLALPLLAQGQVLGVMLVDYRNAPSLYDTVETVRDQRLAVIQGIAHQAAAVIENTALRESQQEEAYVSAALFQVAQTAASLHDLDDILAAIVRITPILVGIERCILFLWDDVQQCFQLSNAYGLKREAETALLETRFAPSDFCMLDIIRDRNRLFVYDPIHPSEDCPEGLSLLPPDFAALMGYLPQGPRSLLGVPLSVQGQVLGAMLVEETESLNRGRERRLEIIAGIAQQAALALQNELLQQARLGQERMDRELQLAREIQQTFVPQQTPPLPGWELASIWRAARQVAGDFFDMIELPGGLMGLLIADVADKGIPAALFMVLTRTLLRAAVRETLSPSAVLARVNDLLVPDARRGMFVTAFYAVLDPASGDLAYANAGHNPPIVRRGHSGNVTRLKTGGIALGVLAGARSTDQAVHLEPGDHVVFYTDGVTEAMSPRGDLYGFDQLCLVVQQSGPGTADHLIQAIDASVAAHVETASASDDLTLIVLHRLRCGNTGRA